MKEHISNAASTSAAFFRLINNPLKYRLFLAKNLPAAFFSGIRIKSAAEDHCAVTVPYKWFTKNPFRSTYFACLSMAAEMSTGVLAMAVIYQRSPSVSMLVVHQEARFFKKATGLSTFVCRDAGKISNAINEAIGTGAGQTITVASTGTNEQGELVAEFLFTWSFKAR